MKTKPETNAGVLRERATRVLKKVIDPELLINIIDLGLVYEIRISPKTIHLQMTLSSPHCPLGDAIIRHAKDVLSSEFPNRSTVIDLVWDPGWNQALITENGRRLLLSGTDN
ncbi:MULTISPECIES: metal-sulfur cluster assembly factor [unclassified Dyadobacter]|mgnify:CR=1 FL=1|jgi:metal-sulfur cluster biosynthetic enzyme|uniref:metal-sulfur cluster assembly factor n=1 Tax=unclassified Dyadobacter TaxID=2625061 RepID=UPI000965C473|nr:metal-sulfur cluster assembly factor [Dyadobacter sp. 50-39]OJV22506.1 MAG: hypothetical protein BGO21_14140 [Dyadobacter sp. 50-39]